MYQFLILAAEAGQTTGDPGTVEGNAFSSFIPLLLMIAVFWFLLVRPEQKKRKKMSEMLSTMQIADEVVTLGGIVGRVVSIKEDTVLIETGGDKTRIRLLKTAIGENRTQREAEAQKAKEASQRFAQQANERAKQKLEKKNK